MRVHWSRWARWLVALAWLSCAGCGGGGQAGPTSASVVFTYTWPPVPGRAVTINSVRIEFHGQVQILTRPATTVVFDNVPVGDSSFQVTTHTDTDGTSPVVASLTWPLHVPAVASVTQTLSWDPASATSLVFGGLGTPPALTLKRGRQATLAVAPLSAQGELVVVSADQVTFASDALDVATVDTHGLVTAVAPGVAHIRAALAGGPLTNTATVTVTPGAVLAVTPAGPLSLTLGQVQQFTARVTGAETTTVRWSSDAGALTAGGLFTAPSAPGVYHVTATADADSTVTQTVDLTVKASTAQIGVQ